LPLSRAEAARVISMGERPQGLRFDSASGCAP
jgi:hypothetical protein